MEERVLLKVEPPVTVIGPDGQNFYTRQPAFQRHRRELPAFDLHAERLIPKRHAKVALEAGGSDAGTKCPGGRLFTHRHARYTLEELEKLGLTA